MNYEIVSNSASINELAETTSPVTPQKTINPQALYRKWQILGNKKTNPPVEPLIPVSNSTFYAGIKTGIYPAPVKIGGRMSVWRGKDLLEFLESLGQKEAK